MTECSTCAGHLHIKNCPECDRSCCCYRPCYRKRKQQPRSNRMARGKTLGPLMALATQIAALPAEERDFVSKAVDELTPQTKRRRRRKKAEDAEAEVEKAPKKAKVKKARKRKKAKAKLLAGTDSDE